MRARQVWIARCAPAPVPEQPGAERGLADAGPILAPECRDPHTGIDVGFQPVEARRTCLQPDHRAVVEPFRQQGLPAEPCRNLADQGGKISRRLELQPVRNSPAFQNVAVGSGKVEDAVGSRLQMHEKSPRCQEARLRIVRRVIIAPGMSLRIGPLRDRRALVPANPGLAGPERKSPAAEVQIGHLLAATPDTLVGVGHKVEPQPVDHGIGVAHPERPSPGKLDHEPNRAVGHLAKVQRVTIDAHMRERPARGDPVGYIEVPAIHLHPLLAAPGDDERRAGRVTDHHPPGERHDEAVLGCLQQHANYSELRRNRTTPLRDSPGASTKTP